MARGGRRLMAAGQRMPSELKLNATATSCPCACQVGNLLYRLDTCRSAEGEALGKELPPSPSKRVTMKVAAWSGARCDLAVSMRVAVSTSLSRNPLLSAWKAIVVISQRGDAP